MARLQKGVRWAGQTYWYQHGKTTELMQSGVDGCNMCKENETPLHQTKQWGVVPARYPYVPRHLLFIPLRHVELFEQLKTGEFKELVTHLSKTLKPGLIAFQNNARQGGATQGHVHVHFLEEPSKQTGAEEKWPGYKFRDPLSLPIIAYAARNDLVDFRQEKTRSDTHAVVFRFSNWKQVFENQGKINQAIRGLREAYEELKKGSKIEIPQGYPARYKQAIETLLEDNKSWGFGYNMAFKKNRNGSIEVHVVPRAVNAIEQVTSKGIKRPIGSSGFEYLTNSGMEREQKTPQQTKTWRTRQEKFGERVVNAIK